MHMGRYQRKNGKMWEFFPSRDHPPLPPVWEPHVWEKIYGLFRILGPERNIFGFQRNVHFLGGIMVCRSGNG